MSTLEAIVLQAEEAAYRRGSGSKRHGLHLAADVYVRSSVEQSRCRWRAALWYT